MEVAYPDPDRTVASYNETLGGPSSVEDFVAKALAQSRGNWDGRFTAQAFNAYIREGFGLPSEGVAE